MRVQSTGNWGVSSGCCRCWSSWSSELESSKRFVPSSARRLIPTRPTYPLQQQTTLNTRCRPNYTPFLPFSWFLHLLSRLQLLRSAGLSHRSVNTETRQTVHCLITLTTPNHVFVILVPGSSQAGDPGQARQTCRAQETTCSAPKGLHLSAREWRCSRGTLKEGTSRYVLN